MSAEEFSKLLAQHIEPVCRMLLGEPNPHMSKPGSELRWGAAGSFSVDLQKGVAFDHQDNEGGGTLWVLGKLQGLSEGEAVDWLRDNGFQLPERTPQAGSNQLAGPGKKETVQTWDYTDREGDPVFQVARVQYRMPDGSWRLNKYGKIEKTFVQRRRFEEEAGVWITGLIDDDYMRKGRGHNWTRYSAANFEKWKMTERRHFAGVDEAPLYRLPEVLDAIAMGQAIHIVEGEKKADALWAAGIAATCNAGGSKKWAPHYNDVLAGAHIVLIPDNDEVGRVHMQLVGSQIRPVAASVRILDIRAFWPEAPNKGDIWDWAQTGVDVGTLYDLVDTHAKPWTKEFPKSRFNAVPFSRIDEPGQEHEYLIHEILTRHEVAVIYGESGSGKSFEAIDLGMAVCRGVKFNGRDVLRGGVIYQAGEGGVGVKKRLRAYRQTYMDRDENPDLILLPARVDLFARDEEDVETSRGTDALIAEIKAWADTFSKPLELVVIDTLATATPGANENASTDMSVVLNNLERIRDECRTAVLMVHHKPRNGNNPRGHSSLFANVDNAIELEITARQDVSQRDDGTVLVRQIHRATVQKNKDGERGHGWDFILKQVVLGKRPSGEPLTSVVCATPGGQAPEVNDDRSLSDQQKIAMTALIKALEEFGEAPSPMLKLPRSIVRVVRMGYWRQEYAALSLVDDEDPKKKTERIKKGLQRAGERFLGAKWIGRAEPYVWLTGRPVPGFKSAGGYYFSNLERPDEPISAGMAEMIDGDIQL
ncbi:AAA family ATPase [Mesorhizobium sp. B2-4-6]|uniref:AAA family ATPase n=1 Tax=Mesorhizobium sp. B2-4-6 TaxID=2589943 RepID=UPI0015E42D03|nr:AAA family ATPase [Mesorhizobium sp. B2-4-6]